MNTTQWCSATFVLLLAMANPAQAATDWWGKATDLFKSADESGVLAEPTLNEISQAFKDALKMSADVVVDQLGVEDGFNGDANVHIPLPRELRKVKELLAKVGLSGVVDDLEVKLNRAAEVATPKARALFLSALDEMTFEDVMTVYKGSDDAATRYFESHMADGLREEMKPIIDESLSNVGAIKAFDDVLGQYQSLPFVPDVKADLTAHVIDEGISGIFHYMAKEEAAIRKDPLKQSTALLKKVFGSKIK